MACKVLIGVPSPENMKYSIFNYFLDAMIKPEGTVVMRAFGQSTAEARNHFIKSALETDAEYIFFCDDDHALPPETLNKLLAHELDCVGGLYLGRNYPFRAMAFENERPDKQVTHFVLDKGKVGLQPVDTLGGGAILCKTEIFKRIPEPWWFYGHTGNTKINDDMGFCANLRKHGISLMLDLETPIGHMGNCIIWPERKNGAWMVTITTNGSGTIQLAASLN